jgi:tetratricopeptide (TPR) repeat protein
MNKLLVAVIGGAMSLAAASGCKQLSEARKAAEALKGTASTTPTDKAPLDSSEEAQDNALASKLGQYIGCLNGASKRVIDSRNRYLSWIADETVGPTGKERNIYGLYDVNTDACYRSLDKAKLSPPALPEVESAADEYKKALSELEPLVKQADRYYRQSDYKDDKMARGKQLHPQLLNAFAKFEQVNKGFEQRVTTLNEGVNGRQLARLEKAPARRLEYLALRALSEGKVLIELVDIGELKQLDLQRYDVAVQSYDKALRELDAYAVSHQPEVAKVSLFSSYVRESDELLKSSKELLRRKRDNKDFNHEFFSKSSPTLVAGHPAQLIDKFNRVVNTSNSLRF